MLTIPDGTVRSPEHEALQPAARQMIRRASRDIVQGEHLLNTSLDDTFTTRAMWTLLVEAENYVLKTKSNSANNNNNNGLHAGLLPQGWVPQMLSLINKAETQVINARTTAEREASRNLCPPFPPPPSPSVCFSPPANDRVQSHKAAPAPAPARLVVVPELRRSLSDDSDIHQSKVAKQKEEDEEETPDFAPYFRALAELQIDIQGLLSVIQAERMRLTTTSTTPARGAAVKHHHHYHPGKRSEAAFLSVLNEEADMLTTTQAQISALYQLPNRSGISNSSMGTGADTCSAESWGEILLEQKLAALPLQLQAIFNMQCREREREELESLQVGSSLAAAAAITVVIDEKAMLRIVMENQNRTEVLRKIQGILREKRDVRVGMCLLKRSLGN